MLGNQEDLGTPKGGLANQTWSTQRAALQQSSAYEVDQCAVTGEFENPEGRRCADQWAILQMPRLFTLRTLNLQTCPLNEQGSPNVKGDKGGARGNLLKTSFLMTKWGLKGAFFANRKGVLLTELTSYEERDFRDNVGVEPPSLCLTLLGCGECCEQIQEFVDNSLSKPVWAHELLSYRRSTFQKSGSFG